MGSREKNDETKRVKKTDLHKKATKKGKKMKFKDKHPRAATAIKIGIVIFILLVIIAVGILVGTFFGVFGDELKISEEELVIKFQNSTVYDAGGEEIATLSGGTKRKIVSMSEINEFLPKAYVAIEDERFYTHRGVDLKRTAAATLTFLMHRGDSSFGGSSITQQLVKNITTDKEDSGLSGVLRKVKEMAKAIQVEQYLSKDQILELYLNIIFVGGDDINGVALGSIYYFDKDVKDLSLAECAYLAGINHSPNAYKPFKDDPEGTMKEKINKRTLTVLSKMKELEYITEEQYNTAKADVESGLNFKKGDGASVTTTISYHTEAAIDQIIEQLKEEKDMDDAMAELYLYSSGLKIYTTQDTSIQGTLEEELVKKEYVKPRQIKEKGKEETRYAIPTMVIVDYKTGQVVAAATATGSEEERTVSTKLGYMNWPTKIKKQTGSSMKPISVIAPGLETGKITAASVYLDCETRFPGMDKSMKNEGAYTNTLMSMRTAIGMSQNIPHAKAMMDIGVDTSIEFCKKMGIKNLKNEGVSLALGGLEEGTSPMHMAMAYATIANDGVYIEPTFYTKVTDSDGNTILEPHQEQTQVLSEQTAYVEKSILTQPVNSGTATYCKMPGIETCAKTGTTNGNLDRWLCGFTPYYAAACWYGYEHSTEVKGFAKNPAGQIWSNVMKAIHTDLPNANFEKPSGIVTATICSISGKVAVEGQCGAVYQEIFAEGTLPGNCDGHMSLPICMETGLIATAACPTEIRNFTTLPESENSGKWTNINPGAYTNPPTDTCPVHAGGAPAAPAEQQPPQTPTRPSATHQHTYIETRTPPNCIVPGKWVYSCTAGDHSYEEVISSEPPTGNHTFSGGKCTVCGTPDPSYSGGGSGTGGSGSGDSGGGSGTGGSGTGESGGTSSTGGSGT